MRTAAPVKKQCVLKNRPILRNGNRNVARNCLNQRLPADRGKGFLLKRKPGFWEHVESARNEE